MKIASLPDGTKLAFESDTPQSEIDEAVKRYIALTKQDSKLVVNVPEQPAPQVKVEVVNESPEIFKDLAEAINKQNDIIAALTTSIDNSTKEIQAHLRKSATAVAAQMKESTNAIIVSANHLHAALTASKEVELDSGGNPVRIRVVKN